MRLGDVTVEVRDKQLNRVGLVRPEELVLDCEDSFNNVGNWNLKLALEHPMAPVLRVPGSGLIVTGPNDVLLSGPMTDWTFTASASDPAGSIQFEGVSDSVVLADTLAWPEPTNADPAHQTVAHDVREGPAESLLHAYVNANCGPGALPDRRKAKLTMGTNGQRGPNLKKSARFQVLGSWLEDIAVLGNLGYRVVQRGSGLVFETFTVRDRALDIRLDVYSGTLSNESANVAAPSATQVIVAGQGDLTERQFYAATNPVALQAERDWGRRIERFVDQRQTDDDTEHVQAANEVLTKEGLTQIGVKLVPTDDATMRFGYDWKLGDRVSVVVLNGEVAATVTGFKLLLDEQGARLGAVIGDPEGFDRQSALAKRLAVLERT